MLSAQVARKNGGFSPEFDHMALLVTLNNRWLADVGFGDSFTEPKLLDYPAPQTDNGRVYRISRKAGGRLLSRRDTEKELWEPQYQFNLRPRRLSDYARRCHWHETSPNSHFRKGRICTKLTPNGRVTLTDTNLIVTRGTKRIERPVKNRTEFDLLLQKHFGISLA